MDNIVITIARQYGSGGKTIAAMLAKELQVNCYSREILRMATENGYRLMGEDGGVIAPGKQADLITINLMQPHLYPTGNVVNTLLECVTAGDVCDNIVNGKILMRDREVLTLDEEKIMKEAAEL